MVLCQTLPKDTWWIFSGDFIKFWGLKVLLTNFSFEKCETTYSIIFLNFYLDKSSHS
jgi:hypothetical protein